MKILHQHNTKGAYYTTLCGKVLIEDAKMREDVLLATLDVDPEDLVNNFGEDVIKCENCLEQVK